MTSLTRMALLPRTLAAVIGLVYLTLGIAGFLAGESTAVGKNDQNALGIFSVSTLLSILHLVIGVFGLLAATGLAKSQFYGWGVFVACVALTAYGVPAAITGHYSDFLNLNWADNVLHAVTALTGLAIGFLPGRVHRADTTDKTVE